MVDSFDTSCASGDTEIERYHDYLRTLRRARAKPLVSPRMSPTFTTWFERQSARLAQLEASPTRALSDDEREFFRGLYSFGPSVRVCEMRTLPDEFLVGFALNSPAANVVFDLDLRFAQQMVRRMEMLTVRHSDLDLLFLQLGTYHAPHLLLLFAAVRRFRRPGQLKQASMGRPGSPQWFTDLSNSKGQLLLTHEVGDLAPMLRPSERIEYMLAYPST